MSKYNPLWEYIKNKNQDEIENVLGFPIDHSFLSNKKELIEYGYIVLKISMKDKKIIIKRQ